MQRTLFILACYFAVCLIGCHDTNPAADNPAEVSSAPQYIRRQNADTVIVFVHGVFGGSVGTWTNSQTGAYWPKLLADDPSFQGSDIYVYSYPTPYVGHSYTIDELIENMRLVLSNDEVFEKHKKVVFLCHSMGGLVVRGFLKRYSFNAQKVPLIYFFSTPTNGAHITQLARFLSKNPQIVGMLPANSEDYVSNLARDWRALPFHVNSRCAYETQDTYGIRIVDEQSASALCDGPLDPIDASHIDIVKPKNREALPYIAFKGAFSAISQASLPPQRPIKTGTVQAGRSIDVDCGQIREDTTLIPPPIEITPQQKVIDAIASLQEGSNLKEQKVEMKGVVNQMAQVHYRIVGLDNPAAGACSAKGFVILLVTFVVSQPSELFTVGLTPIETDDIWLGLASKSGTFRIRNPRLIPAIDSQSTGHEALINRSDLYIKGTAEAPTWEKVPFSKFEQEKMPKSNGYDLGVQKAATRPAGSRSASPLRTDKPDN